MSYLWNNKAKWAPQDRNGYSLPIESLDLRSCTFQANSKNPASTCEHRDEIEHYLKMLSKDAHRQVLQLLLADFTWSDIGTKLDVNPKTVRLWVAQMRRILSPHTSHVNRQPST